jgi:hypothetical protein
MRPLRCLVVASLLLPLALTGCKIDTINSFHPVPAQVRFANFVLDGTSIDVTSSGATLWSATPQEAVTAYREFDAEQRSFGLRINGGTTDLVNNNDVLNGDQRYTLVAFGTAAVPSTLVVPDLTTEPGGNNFRLRAINVVPTSVAVDVYVTAPDADLANLAPNVATLAYGSTSVYSSYPAGTYRIRITTYATKDLLFDSGTLTVDGNKVANLIIYSRGSATLVNLAVMETTGAAAMTIAESTLARIRAIHLANGIDTLDLLADRVPLFTSLVYGTPASYTKIAPGAHDFTLEALTARASLGSTLRPATDTSLYVSGSAGAASLSALQDNSVGALSGRPRLRIANLTADGVTIDLVAGDTVLATGITATAAPSYVEFSAGTYVLKARNSATQVTLATIDSFTASASSVYTAYVAGTTAQPKITVVQDK